MCSLIEAINFTFMKKVQPLFIVLFLFGYSLCFASTVQPVLVIDETQNEFTQLTDYLTILEDPEHAFTIGEVSSTSFQKSFQPYAQFSEKLNHKHTYWGKIVFKSNLSRDSDWILLFEDYWPINFVEAYVARGGENFKLKKAGKLTPTPALDVKEGRFNKINIFIPKGNEPTTVYLKIHNIDHRPLDFNLTLQHQVHWLRLLEINDILQAIFHGILWVMIIYNFFMFISVSDKAYLYYVLYMVLLSAYALYYMGYLKSYVIGSYPKVVDYIYVVSAYAPSIFYFLFARYYFRIKGRLPKADWLIQTWITIKSAIVILLLLLLAFFYNMRLVGYLGSYIMLFEIGLYVLTLVYVVYATVKTKTKNALYFVIGTSILIISTVIFILNILIRGEGNFLILQAGIIIELIFFSFGLADRMKLREIKMKIARERLIEQLQENERLQTQINRELEQKVLQRTQEISRQKEEITQKNEALMALNEEKNHLISIVAHDLGNPLANIKLYAQIIKRTAQNLTSKQAQQLDVITESTENMMQMINKILDVNAIEAGKINMNKEVTKLSLLLKEAIDQLSFNANKKDITLHFKNAEGEKEANIDHFYTKHIFENLISNAIKFSPVGKNVFIHLSSEREKLRVEITDEGPGICEEDMKKIFRKYQKLSARPTAGERSTGLGLSIVKKYVDLMEGKVWCKSDPGQGATFIIEFNQVKTPVSNRV